MRNLTFTASLVIAALSAPVVAAGAQANADATPFLLGRIVEITGGASLTANIALVKNNARLGAQIAVAYAALEKKGAR